MDEETVKLQHTLLGTDDAMVWAEEFCRIFDGYMIGQEAVEYTDNHQRIDEGAMVGWFANAMQTAIHQEDARRIHAVGGMTVSEEFLHTWEMENPLADPEVEVVQTWDDEDFRDPDDIIDLVEAIQRDEEEARAREGEFLRGFDEGRDNSHEDPYGDT